MATETEISPSESGRLCQIKASVPTGLEVGASEELQELLGRPARTSRGRIIFNLNTVEELLKVGVQS